MTAPHPLAERYPTEDELANAVSQFSLAELAATARTAANAARDGSAERKASGCVAVALATTRSLAAARRALETVRPDAVRDDALAYLDRLIDEQEMT